MSVTYEELYKQAQDTIVDTVTIQVVDTVYVDCPKEEEGSDTLLVFFIILAIIVVGIFLISMFD